MEWNGGMEMGVSNRWTEIWNGMVEWKWVSLIAGLKYGMEWWNGNGNETVNIHSCR